MGPVLRDGIDFDEFVWIWNEHQGLATPDLHIRICRWLSGAWENGDRDLLLMAFRNSGKSTLVGLFAAWRIVLDPSIRILVLAADRSLARKMVRTVKRTLERHPLGLSLKPERAEQWAGDRFTVSRRTELRDPTMAAKGIGANITGSRADIIIYDDVEVPNTADTPSKRENLRDRLVESGFVLVPGGTRLYVGTPHTFDSLYRATPSPDTPETPPFLDGFARLEVPVVDDAGTSQWPEQFPAECIERLKRSSGPSKFASQMMLRPVAVADGRLDPARLRRYDATLDDNEANGEHLLLLRDRRLVSASCWWDPAFGMPNRGDASVVACVFTDDHGAYWLHDIAYLTHAPERADEIDEATQMCRQVAHFAKRNLVPSITLETNGLGRFLPGLLRREVDRAGIRCTVLETVSSRAKDLRILDAFDAVLAAGRLNVHARVWQTPFIAEMREWRPGSRVRDDGLDAVSGCLLSEPVRLPRAILDRRTSARPRSAWNRGGTAYSAKTAFSV